MKVTLLEGNQQYIAVAGALGCASDRSSADICAELNQMEKGDAQARCVKVLAGSFGRGHGSVGDQANYTFSLEGVSRLVTLFFCQSTHSSHLQQSLRWTKAGGFVLPSQVEQCDWVKDVCVDAYSLYRRMMDAGVPPEDARYILPLAASTNIQVHTNARELCHYMIMSQAENTPGEVKAVVAKMLEAVAGKDEQTAILENYGANFEGLSFYPAPALFAGKSPVDSLEIEGEVTLQGYMPGLMPDNLGVAIGERSEGELAVLKHTHFTFALQMSIASFHQAVRQRTWDHSVETLAHAARKQGRVEDMIEVPASIVKGGFEDEYKLQARLMLDGFRALRDALGEGKGDAFAVLPHCLKVKTVVHINGWNAIHSIGKRTCTKAQWEIRRQSVVMAKMMGGMSEELKSFMKPQCFNYGKCPEIKPCRTVFAEAS